MVQYGENVNEMQNPSGKNKDGSDGLEINRIFKTGISEYDATYHVINSKEFQRARVLH